MLLYFPEWACCLDKPPVNIEGILSLILFLGVGGTYSQFFPPMTNGHEEGRRHKIAFIFKKKNHFFIELTVNDCCVDFKCMVLCLSYEHELQQCNTSLYSRWTILILGNQCLNVGAEEDLLLENMFFLKRKGKSSFWQFCLVTVSFWGLTEQNYLYIVCICKLWSFKPEGHKKHECVFNPVKRL